MNAPLIAQGTMLDELEYARAEVPRLRARIAELEAYIDDAERMLDRAVERSPIVRHLVVGLIEEIRRSDEELDELEGAARKWGRR